MSNNIQVLIELLKQKGVLFSEGLLDNEILEIELKWNFVFPPDLKLLLQIAVPISEGFTNWRELDKEKDKFDWPLDGLLFDVKNNSFWFDSWGMKPSNYQDQKKIVELNYNSYPKLIPIYSHRYIPTMPSEIGNPVFSVYQTDIVYYGYDLYSYFQNEFKLQYQEDFIVSQEPRKIPFWSEIAELTI